MHVYACHPHSLFQWGVVAPPSLYPYIILQMFYFFFLIFTRRQTQIGRHILYGWIWDIDN